MEKQELECLYYETDATPTTVKEVILDYTFKKERPETYQDEFFLEEQCDSGRNRSIDDMILIVRAFIPEATCKDVIDAVVEINKVRLFDRNVQSILIYYCSDINKPVFMLSSCRYHFWKDLIYSSHISPYYQWTAKVNSQYSIEELWKIHTGEMKEKEEGDDKESNRQTEGQQREET